MSTSLKCFVQSLQSPIFAGALVIFLLGYTLGQFVMSAKIQDVPLKMVEDTRQLVPVVDMEGIKDGQLEGTLKGDVRLFLGNDPVLPDGSGAFKVPADSLFINYVRVVIPEGMRFVASKRGKNYYPVSSSAGEKIIPENRVYFRDEDAAQQAGFKRGS